MNQQFDEATIRRALYANVRDETFSGSVRTYLTRLLADVWSRRDDFSGKRPFGMSGWQVVVYSPLIRADLIEGEFDGERVVTSPASASTSTPQRSSVVRAISVSRSAVGRVVGGVTGSSLS